MGKDSHFTGQPVYSQVLKLLDKDKIRQISHDTQGSESYVKRFGGYEHLVVMLFGVLKHFDSLRELEIGMKAEAHKLSHLGIDYLVRRSTLAEANIRRPQEFFASFYAYLLEKYAKFLADSNIKQYYSEIDSCFRKNFSTFAHESGFSFRRDTEKTKRRIFFNQLFYLKKL